MSGIDAQGRTPLHYAAMTNDADAVREPLTEEAGPNVPDRLGFTALHLAAQEGAISAAAILLAAGARVDAAATATGTRRCSPPYSTAAAAASSSGCYATTEPTPGTRTTQGRPRPRLPA